MGKKAPCILHSSAKTKLELTQLLIAMFVMAKHSYSRSRRPKNKKLQRA
jgi:hypothetical protein